LETNRAFRSNGPDCTFAGLGAGLRGRALVTLLFTDLVDSTATAKQLGDTAWRDLLTAHFEAVRAELDRFGGREVATTGDGMFATFDGPAPALHCARLGPSAVPLLGKVCAFEPAFTSARSSS
jgi:class 3 adenylate cyclase